MRLLFSALGVFFGLSTSLANPVNFEVNQLLEEAQNYSLVESKPNANKQNEQLTLTAASFTDFTNLFRVAFCPTIKQKNNYRNKFGLFSDEYIEYDCVEWKIHVSDDADIDRIKDLAAYNFYQFNIKPFITSLSNAQINSFAALQKNKSKISQSLNNVIANPLNHREIELSGRVTSFKRISGDIYYVKNYMFPISNTKSKPKNLTCYQHLLKIDKKKLWSMGEIFSDLSEFGSTILTLTKGNVDLYKLYKLKEYKAAFAFNENGIYFLVEKPETCDDNWDDYYYYSYDQVAEILGDEWRDYLLYYATHLDELNKIIKLDYKK